MYCYNYQIQHGPERSTTHFWIMFLHSLQIKITFSQLIANKFYNMTLLRTFGMKFILPLSIIIMEWNVIFNGSVYSNNLVTIHLQITGYWPFVQCSNMHNLNGNVYAVRGFNSTFQMFDSVSQSWLNRACIAPSLILTFTNGTIFTLEPATLQGFYKYDSQLDSMIQRANFPGPWSNSGSFVWIINFI